ncbi:hypothetical protein AB684_11100 [Bacillus licheniformis]|uniref:Uncharacterized protein n=1 Tax=Bacillus licheniformis TaxID=1402 RepID=A0AB37GMF7_BACLI|nr:hypothetical protein [Bacillus licheniformis]AMR10703.1 hypothetical protein AB684_11100 [Bacillus licheniformis]KJH58772.1 hypothetical protein UF14_10240 [Bacillus licheniformis]KYC83585.1 hypothetical protein B4091_2163 [Bacillus licheniformis]MCM3374113.1 hypothetical protein [Bacillus licheniformis]MCM3433534.1 hypothetical protein [Bacillus licheniformis]
MQSEFKVFKFNDYDSAAAVSEEAGRKAYLEFTGLSEEEAFDEAVYDEIDPNCNRVIVSEPGQEVIKLTYIEAYEKGYFTLPAFFTTEY